MLRIGLKSWFSLRARRDVKTGRRLARQADGARDNRRFAEAAALYRSALALLPGETGLRVQCGNMLKEIGRLDEAERHYALADAARPDDADLALQRGHLHKLAGRFGEAARFYHRAAELRPDWTAPATELAGLSENGWSGAPPVRTLDEAKKTIEASGLFDPAVYRCLNPDLGPTALDPLDHFLMIGVRERRRPHPLFDVDHYFKTVPEVGRSAVNPLDDFLRRWREGGRDPNPFFDTALYARENPDLAASGLDPLSHYVRIGAARGAHPSRLFDPVFYVRDDPDVLSSNLDPLTHYMVHGRLDGRRINAEQARPGPSRPVTAARLLCRKAARPADETVLFVAHAPAGRLKPHVGHTLRALRRQNIATVLVVACDTDVERFADPAADLADALYIRENEGYDFAAWAHVLATEPALYDVERLYLMNDSLFGPTSDAAFGHMLDRARAMSADLVGITDCYERAWHIHSFFLLLNASALRSAAFRTFMGAVVAYAEKDDVIFDYECKLAGRLRAGGFTCGTLFEAGGRNNATLFRWKALLEAGFPFVKVGLIRDAIQGADSTGWRAALEARGYDTRLVDLTLAEARAGSAPNGDDAKPDGQLKSVRRRSGPAI